MIGDPMRIRERVPRIGPTGDVVRVLESMLEEAKAGKWDGCIVMTYDSKTGDNARAWRGNLRLFAALGMLEAAKAGCLAEVMWEAEEVR